MHEKYIPLNGLSEYMETLKDQPAFNKLIRVLSEWFALMELCDDLLERIEIYGIAHYIDVQSAEKKIRDNWGIHQQKEQDNYLVKTLDGAKGVFGHAIVTAGRAMSRYLSWFGLIGII